MIELTRAERMKQAGIRNFGSEEAWRESLRQNGSKGGKRGKGHKFGHGKVDPSEAAKKALKNRWGNGKDSDL